MFTLCPILLKFYFLLNFSEWLCMCITLMDILFTSWWNKKDSKFRKKKKSMHTLIVIKCHCATLKSILKANLRYESIEFKKYYFKIFLILCLKCVCSRTILEYLFGMAQLSACRYYLTSFLIPLKMLWGSTAIPCWIHPISSEKCCEDINSQQIVT